jgi:hypothetical protein
LGVTFEEATKRFNESQAKEKKHQADNPSSAGSPVGETSAQKKDRLSSGTSGVQSEASKQLALHGITYDNITQERFNSLSADAQGEILRQQQEYIDNLQKQNQKLEANELGTKNYSSLTLSEAPYAPTAKIGVTTEKYDTRTPELKNILGNLDSYYKQKQKLDFGNVRNYSSEDFRIEGEEEEPFFRTKRGDMGKKKGKTSIGDIYKAKEYADKAVRLDFGESELIGTESSSTSKYSPMDDLGTWTITPTQGKAKINMPIYKDFKSDLSSFSKEVKEKKPDKVSINYIEGGIQKTIQIDPKKVAYDIQKQRVELGKRGITDFSYSYEKSPTTKYTYPDNQIVSVKDLPVNWSGLPKTKSDTISKISQTREGKTFVTSGGVTKERKNDLGLIGFQYGTKTESSTKVKDLSKNREFKEDDPRYYAEQATRPLDNIFKMGANLIGEGTGESKKAGYVPYEFKQTVEDKFFALGDEPVANLGLDKEFLISGEKRNVTPFSTAVSDITKIKPVELLQLPAIGVTWLAGGYAAKPVVRGVEKVAEKLAQKQLKTTLSGIFPETVTQKTSQYGKTASRILGEEPAKIVKITKITKKSSVEGLENFEEGKYLVDIMKGSERGTLIVSKKGNIGKYIPESEQVTEKGLEKLGKKSGSLAGYKLTPEAGKEILKRTKAGENLDDILLEITKRGGTSPYIPVDKSKKFFTTTMGDIKETKITKKNYKELGMPKEVIGTKQFISKVKETPEHMLPVEQRGLKEGEIIWYKMSDIGEMIGTGKVKPEAFLDFMLTKQKPSYFPEIGREVRTIMKPEPASAEKLTTPLDEFGKAIYDTPLEKELFPEFSKGGLGRKFVSKTKKDKTREGKPDILNPTRSQVTILEKEIERLNPQRATVDLPSRIDFTYPKVTKKEKIANVAVSGINQLFVNAYEISTKPKEKLDKQKAEGFKTVVRNLPKFEDIKSPAFSLNVLKPLEVKPQTTQTTKTTKKEKRTQDAFGDIYTQTEKQMLAEERSRTKQDYYTEQIVYPTQKTSQEEGTSTKNIFGKVLITTPEIKLDSEGLGKIRKKDELKLDTLFTPIKIRTGKPDEDLIFKQIINIGQEQGGKVGQTPKLKIDQQQGYKFEQIFDVPYEQPFEKIPKEPIPQIPFGVPIPKGGLFPFGDVSYTDKDERGIGKYFRVYDIAKEPFGDVKVGLGYFEDRPYAFNELRGMIEADPKLFRTVGRNKVIDASGMDVSFTSSKPKKSKRRK